MFEGKLTIMQLWVHVYRLNTKVCMGYVVYEYLVISVVLELVTKVRSVNSVSVVYEYLGIYVVLELVSGVKVVKTYFEIVCMV